MNHLEICIHSYESKDCTTLQKLLLELQRAVAAMDPEGLNIVGADFESIYTAELLRRTEDLNGCILIAEIDGTAVGFIAGAVEQYDAQDLISYACPMEGRVLELYVRPAYRGRSVGAALMRELEHYFKRLGCVAVHVEVFAHNEGAMRFYSHHGYEARTLDLRRELPAADEEET